MKTIIPVVIILILADLGNSHALTLDARNRDSLRAVVRHGSLADTAILRTACLFTQTFDYVEPDSMMYYSRLYYDAAVKANYPYGIAYTRVLEGWYYLETGEKKKALGCFISAIRPAIESGDSSTLAFIYGEVGNGYQSMGMQDRGCDYQLRAIHLFKATGQPEEELKRWTSLAQAYGESGNLPKAIGILEKVIRTFDSLKLTNISLKSGTIDALGTFYMLTGKPENAMKAYKEAMRLHRQEGNLYFCSITLYNISRLLLQESLNLCGNIPGEKRKNADMALEYLDELDSVSAQLGDSSSLADCNVLKARALLQKGQSRDALALMLRWRNYLAKSGVLDSRLYFIELLGEIYESVGENTSALTQYKFLLSLKDSLEKVKIAEKVSLLTESYDIEQMEETLTQKEQQIASGRFINWLFITISFLILLLALIVLYFLRQKQKTAKQLQHRNEEVEKARLRAEASEKFKEQFLANMSHEIRTPLNAVIGMTGLLLDENHPPKTENYLRNIKQAGEHLTGIINDILDLSKLEAGKLELHIAPFCIKDLLDEMKNLFGIRTQEKKLDLVIDCSELVPRWVFGDIGRIRQILFNLVGNAVKFTDHGSVVIKVDLPESEEEKPVIRFMVEDTGPGIPQDEQSRIFGEFVQGNAGENKPSGTGLGLSISKRLAGMMDGTIAVKSESGKGSAFMISLPLKMASGEEFLATCGKDNSAAAMKGSYHILVVDDNLSNQIVALGMLERLLPESVVSVAASGTEALEFLGSEMFDLVLMDVRMPGMDGYETTRKLRSLSGGNARIPVIALTASVIRSDVEACRKAGMDDYIPKPINREILVKALKKHLKIGDKEIIYTSGTAPVSIPEDPLLKPAWAPLLMDMCNGKKERFINYLHLFITETQTELQRWDELIAGRQHERLARSLHKIMPQIRIFMAGIQAGHAMELDAAFSQGWDESYLVTLIELREGLMALIKEAESDIFNNKN